MDKLLLICLAGAFGTGLRYLVTVWAGERFGVTFPYGTLFVNLAGSFAIGFLIEVSLRRAAFTPELRLVLTTGFLGGLTTYSSFNYEAVRLLQGDAFGSAALYFVLTTVGGLGLGFGGIALARALG